MKWYHLPILISVGLAVLAIEQRVLFGGANTLIVLGAIPGLIYVSSKSLEFVIGNRF